MTGRSTDTVREPKTLKEKQADKKYLDDLLDKGLEESFPASDPPAVVGPGHGIPTEDPPSGA